jgi:hypothetical protein
MHVYDARHQFIEGLDRYVSGIETDQGLERLAKNVSKYHDRMPEDAVDMVSAIVWPLRRFTNSYAGASEILLERFRALGGKKEIRREGSNDALMDCTEGSPEEKELARITDVIEAYETKRWPSGRWQATRVSRAQEDSEAAPQTGCGVRWPA